MLKEVAEVYIENNEFHDACNFDGDKEDLSDT